VSDKTDVYVAGAGEPVARPARVPQERTSQDIRQDIEAARVELGQAVDTLRGRVNELTDWRRQVREHQREIIIGAAVVGFAVGAMMVLRGRGD
jgi:hypothetical protein